MTNMANGAPHEGIRPLASRSVLTGRRVPFGAPTQAPRPGISVIIPMRNERENVLPLAKQVLQALSGQRGEVELILVDDASNDGTWDQILAAQQADPRVRALRHERQSGQSAALWTGFEASRGEVLATLDGDLQNDPADLPRMLAALARCDLVCGVRAVRNDNTVRRISSFIARRARKAALGVDFKDIGCNLRVLKRRVLESLLPFDGLHRFLPVLAQDAGAVVEEMDVAHHPRTAGRSKYGVWNRLGRGVWDLSMIAWYRKRQMPSVPVVEHHVQRA